MPRSFLDWTRCLFGRQQTKSRAREDLANQTLASRLKRQKRAGDAAIRQKRLKAELQQRKLLEEIGFD
jgi:hypothetical protein